MIKCKLALVFFIATLSPLFSQIDAESQMTKKQQEDFKNRPNSTDVTDHIFMLKKMGGNIAVQHGIDGVLMVDTQFDRISESIQSIVYQKTNDSVEFVINTHMHGDHTGGNKNFTRAGATVLAHANVRNAMIEKMSEQASAEAINKSEATLAKMKEDGNEEKARRIEERMKQSGSYEMEVAFEIDYEALPAISFESDLLFHYNDEDIKLIHLPNAHTNGDIAVYFNKSNVLHSGDAFVNGMYPFIDLNNGGSFDGYLKGLTALQNLANKSTKIIPGHGEIADVSAILEMKKMLQLYYDRIKFHFLNNKTENEIAAMRDFTQYYDDKGFGDGFISTEKLLRTLYKEVEKKEGPYKQRQDLRQKKYNELKSKAEKKGNK